jgi:hypothetical protein
MYTLATAGRKIGGKLGETKAGGIQQPKSPSNNLVFSFPFRIKATRIPWMNQSLRGFIGLQV